MATAQSSHTLSRLLYLTIICLVAAIGGLLFGFDTAVISGTVGMFTAEFQLADKMEGWVVGSAIVGCFVGALAAGTLSDRFGRKRVLLLSAILFTASAVWCGLAGSAQELVWARIIGGLGIGIASLVSPLYIAEISPPHIRGRLVALQQLAIVLGILAAFFSNSLIRDTAWSDAAKWRWMFAVETLPATLFFGLIFPIPESPRWLTKQGFKDQARSILARVVGATKADAEMAQIVEAIAHEGGSIKDLLKPGLRRAVLIGVTLMVLTQVTGINAIMYYAPEVFKHAGSGAAAAYNDAVWVGLTNLVFTLLSMAVVDKLGRKPLLIIGSTCMGLALLSVGYFFHLSSLLTPGDLKSLPQLAGKLEHPADPLSRYLHSRLSTNTLQKIQQFDPALPADPALQSALLQELNHLIQTGNLYAADRFAGVNLGEETRDLIRHNPAGQDRVRLNRMLLDDAYGDCLVKKGRHRGTLGWPLLLGVLAYVASFAFSMGVVGWVVISEIYPTRTRGRAMAIATAGVWGACYLVSQTFPILRDRAGMATTFWIYALMCILALLFVLRFIPETKGRSLEEIEKSWSPS